MSITAISHITVYIGNLKQLMDPQGWAFHQSLADSYGSVIKYRGIGNVSSDKDDYRGYNCTQTNCLIL